MEEIEKLAGDLKSKLQRHVEKNQKRDCYYYNKNRVKDLGINTPNIMQNLALAVSWPTMAVDTVAERINFDGFWTTDDEDDSVAWLSKIFEQNSFESRQKESLKNSLISGIGFISIGVGNTDLGEPEIVWLTEDSSKLTITYDHRAQRTTNALRYINDNSVIIYTENLNYKLVSEDGNKWFIESSDEHNLGFVPIVPIINNADSKHLMGQTEISRSIISSTDEALRSILGSAVAREYYSLPQRYLLGADRLDVEALAKGGTIEVRSKAGDIEAISGAKDKDGNVVMPTLEEFTGSDPSVVLKMIEPHARLVAREIGVTPSYMGFDSVNPASADAINAAEDKLLRRVAARVPFLRKAYKQLAEYSLRLSGRGLPENFDELQVSFARTDTVTPQAAADRLSKLQASGVFERELPDFIYNELGLSHLEKKQIKAWLAKQNASNVIAALTAGIEEGE